MALEDTAHALLSTVPEVLAGMVALLGAFVLFRIGGLQRRIEKLGEAVLRSAGLPEDLVARLETAFAEHRRRAIQEELDRWAPNVEEARQASFARARGRLDDALVYRKALIEALTVALWVNALAMLAPVGALLVLQPLLAKGVPWVLAAMALAAAGMVASFAANTRVLYQLLR